MNKDLIDELGQLTYLRVDEAKKATFAENFQGIISHIDQLSQLDIAADTLPTYYTQTLRDDKAVETTQRFANDTKQKILAEMPKTQDRYLVVKAILKG
jgi:aspartyl/glutamyl-tRNA(Asn/Gln) amidotransferase C subunit